MKLFVSLLSLLFFCSVCFSQEPAAADSSAVFVAKQIFKRFEQLSADFDPRLEGLYADNADIRIVVTYPRDKKKAATMQQTVGSVYRAIIVASMAAAKARGDKNTYSDVTFTEISPTRVEIKAKRHSLMKGYTSPFRMTVSYANRQWLISEEYVLIEKH